MNRKLIVLLVMLLIVAFTLTACMEKDTYTVTFDSNGGSSVDSQSITDGSTATEPVSPTMDGYTFAGWYASGSDTAFDFSTTITANITLTAQWTADEPAQADTFTVSFDSDVASQTVNSGSTATEPESLTKQGYTFAGWFEADSDTAFDFSTAITADISLVAQWTINTYTVAFGDSSSTLAYGADITAPTTNPTKDSTAEFSYEFASWNTLADGTGDSFVADSTATGDITYYAQFTATTRTYTVAFGDNSSTLEYGADITAPATNPTKDSTAEFSYEFASWNTLADGTGDSFVADSTVTGDVTYYAQYTESTRTYTVIFDGVSYAQSYGATISAPTTEPTKDSTVEYTYSFAGWNTSSDGTGSTLTDSVTVSGDAEYFAQYTVSSVVYVLSYDINGGTGEAEDIEVAYNSAIGNLPTVTYQGMQLVGWYIGDDMVDNTTIWTYSSNQTAVAKWEVSIDILNNISNYGETFAQVWEEELMYTDDAEVLLNKCSEFDTLSVASGHITAIAYAEFASVPLLIQIDSVSMANKLNGVEISLDTGDGLVYYTLTAIDNICYIDSYSVYSLLVLGETPVYDNGIYYTADMSGIIRATSQVSGDVYIPNTVTSIASSAFANNDQISTITFGGSTSTYMRTSFVATNSATVTCEIADYAFYACFNLTEIIFAEGTTISAIGEGAFMRCSSLFSIVGIEYANIESIGDYAFASCFDLQYFYVPDSVVTLGSYVFQNCVNMQTVDIGEDSQLEIISDYCFAGITFSSINIPVSVQYIGKYAFYETGLTSVTFAENSNLQTIDIYAFYNCTITSLDLPASLVSIGAYAFYSNDFVIQSVTFAQDGNLTTIGNFAFGMGDAWYYNTATELYIPASVVTIGEGAFSGFMYLDTLEIAEDSVLQYIGRYAFTFSFDGTASCHITLPATVTYVGEYAFSGAADNNISMTIPEDNSLETIGHYAFMCISIDSLVLTDAITFIGSCAFENTGLNAVSLDANAQLEIIYPAIFGNTNITSIVIPDSVTTIAEFAFSGCASLTTVTFSSNSQLTTIGMGAFSGCPIENFYLSAAVSSVGEYALAGSTYISVEEGSEYYCSIDGNLYSADGTVLVCVCTNAMDSSVFVVPEGVVTIQSGAFSGGIYFNTIALPSTLQYMTFSELYASAITISTDNPYYCLDNGILYNGDKTVLMQYVYAVGDTLTIPDSVVEISDSALYYAQYSYVVFGEDSQLTTIGYNAFSASSIYSINIPAAVTYIGDGAFMDCRNLTTVIFADGIDISTIPMYVFADTAITSISIPASVTTIGEGAFMYCWDLTTVTFAEDSSLRTIGALAFCNTALSGELVLPIGVVSIGECAFGMTNITSVYIPVTVTYVGWEAFTDCYNLQLITYACGEMESLMMYGCEVEYSEDYEIFDNYGYVVAGGSVYIVAYFGGEPEVVIPSEIDGLPVVSFGTVFAYHDELTSITIPSSVEYISDYAFAGCYELMYLTFDGDSSVTYIGDYAFADANLMGTLYLPATVESIGTYAFAYCNLDALVIPTDSVLVTIGEGAFLYSGISGEVYIPATVVLAEWSFAIFAGNNITEFVVAEGNSTAMAIDGNLYIYWQSDTLLELCLIQYATGSSATLLELSDDVVAIFPYAVMGATNLCFVTIPDTVYYIGDFAFSAPLTILCESSSDGGWDQWYEDGCTVIYGASPDYFLTVIFDSCGGSSVAGQLLNEGDMVATPASPTLFGYTFSGWYVDEQCTQLYDFSTTLVEGITLYAGWVEAEEFEYTAVDGGYELTKYNGTDSEVVVPSSYNGLPVVGIGEMAFVMFTASGDINFEQIISITLPDTITYIGDLAFAATSIVTIQLPASVTSVGTGIFMYCYELQSVTMASSASSQYVVVGSVMYSSDMTTLVACFVSMDTFVLPITVTTISQYAFEGLELNTLVLHQDIDIINIGAFAVESYLTVYTLFDQYSCPSGWNYAFNLANTTIYFDGEWEYEGDAPTATVTRNSDIEYMLVNDNYAYIVSGYYGNDETVEIPSYYNGIAVIGIGEYWYNGIGMTTLILPDTIQYFAEYSFATYTGYIDTLQYVYYSGDLASYLAITFAVVGTPTYNGASLYIDDQLLTELVITVDMVSAIPDCAFYGNTSITSVVIGDGIVSIGSSAFAYCTNLASVVLGEGIECIGSFAFSDCTSLVSVYISSTVVEVGAGAFRSANVDFAIAEGNEYLLTNGSDLYTAEGTLLHGVVDDSGVYTVPEYITYIEMFAFANNEDLTMFIIPEDNSLYGISEMAIYWCYNIMYIIVPGEYFNSFLFAPGAYVITQDEMHDFTIIANGGVFNVESLQDNTFVVSVTEDMLVLNISRYTASYENLCALLGDDFVTHDSLLFNAFGYLYENWYGSADIEGNSNILWENSNSGINVIIWGQPITVTLNSGDYQFVDGGFTASFEQVSGSSVTVGSDYSIQVPDGYTLVGWSLTEGGEVEDTIYTDTDIELYAVYKQSVTITVDPDGGYVDLTTAYDIGFEYVDGYLVYTYAEGSTVSADIICMLMEIIYKDDSQLSSFVYYDTNGDVYVPSQFGDYYEGMYLEFVLDQDIVIVPQWSVSINVVFYTDGAEIADHYMSQYDIDWYAGTMTTYEYSNSYFYLPTASSVLSMDGLYATGWSLTPGGDIVIDIVLGEDTVYLYPVWEESATVVVYFGDNVDSSMLEWAFDGNTTFDYCGDYIIIYSYVGANFYEQNMVSELQYNVGNYDGYEFAGYSIDPNGSELIGDSYTLVYYNELYMVWVDPNVTYTVTIDLDGGYYTEDAQQYLWEQFADQVYYINDDGMQFVSSIELELYMLTRTDASPIYDSYTLLGFSYEQGGEVLGNSTIYITTDTTLYAVWAETVAISYNMGDLDLINDYNNLFDEDNISVEYSTVGAEVDLQTMSYLLSDYCWKYGYYFAGWSLTDGGDILDELILEDDVVLYAVWLEGVTITLDGNGATLNSSILAHYSGMYTEGDSQLVGYAEPNSYWAEWTDYNAWYYNFENRVEYDGYYFVGFSYTPDGELVDSTALYIDEDDVTLYAIWAQYITVTIYVNGGTIYNNISNMTADGDKYVGEYYVGEVWSIDSYESYFEWASYVSYHDHYFVGFSYTPDGELIGDLTVLLSEDIEIYVRWSYCAEVTIDANGGTIYDDYNTDGYMQFTAYSYVASTIESYTTMGVYREGYTYSYLSYDAAGEYPVEAYIFDSDVKLYIQWNYTENYMLYLNANGGAVDGQTINAMYVAYDNGYVAQLNAGYILLDTMTLMLNCDELIYRLGWLIIGWSYTPDGEIIDNNLFMLTENTTLYAIWGENTNPTISLDANGGVINVDEIFGYVVVGDRFVDYIYYGEVSIYDITSEIKYYNAISYEGYTFAGLSYTPDGEIIYDFYITITEDTVLYAVWE